MPHLYFVRKQMKCTAEKVIKHWINANQQEPSNFIMDNTKTQATSLIMFSYCKGQVYFREKARTLLSYPMWPRRPLVAGAISKQISALSPFNLQHCYLKRLVFSGTPTHCKVQKSLSIIRSFSYLNKSETMWLIKHFLYIVHQRK